MNTETETVDRQYDVIVWGASGFTGKLVVEYFLEQYGKDIAWAIAGRNRQKLEQTLQELSASGKAPDILIADSHDAESMAVLAQATRVVLTTVGPYALYGDMLVDACAEHGTHYCDLAGEVQWMRRVIDRNQSTAEQSGARIVHSCGFDSIPSDLGVQFLQEQAIMVKKLSRTEKHWYLSTNGNFSLSISADPSARVVSGNSITIKIAYGQSVADSLSFDYLKVQDTTDGVPWVVETAFGWCPDVDTRRLVTGVNWSPGIINPFRELGHFGQSLDTILSQQRADRDEPVILVLHMACPRVEYTDRGKSAVVVRS